MTPERHWMIIITGANRHPAKSTDEKATLLDSVLAYSGKYTIEEDKIRIEVDMSANEVFTGANQVQTNSLSSKATNSRFKLPKLPALPCPERRSLAPMFLNESAEHHCGKKH
jgi:hypothetical protein